MKALCRIPSEARVLRSLIGLLNHAETDKTVIHLLYNQTSGKQPIYIYTNWNVYMIIHVAEDERDGAVNNVPWPGIDVH